jgi:fatty acid desaturase
MTPRRVGARREDGTMTIDRAVMAFAGSVVLVSLALGFWVSPWWLLLAAFVGTNLLQAAFSGVCPLAILFKRMGMRPGAAF